MRSAADIPEVGCPEPAAVVQRMLSMRSCCASSFQFATWSAMSPSPLTRPPSLGRRIGRHRLGYGCGASSRRGRGRLMIVRYLWGSLGRIFAVGLVLLLLPAWALLAGRSSPWVTAGLGLGGVVLSAALLCACLPALHPGLR